MFLAVDVDRQGMLKWPKCYDKPNKHCDRISPILAYTNSIKSIKAMCALFFVFFFCKMVISVKYVSVIMLMLGANVGQKNSRYCE